MNYNGNRKKPPRLPIIFQQHDAPLCFVTFNTWHRMAILDCDLVHETFVSHCQKVAEVGVGVGRYVIMPDHIHLFIRITPDLKLGKSVKFIKQAITKVLRKESPKMQVWQPGFFDHLLRSSESYAQKWEYVKDNPVRAGLVNVTDDWLY